MITSRRFDNRIRFDQFGIRTLFLGVTLCAAICALVTAFGLGAVFALLAIIVWLSLGFVLTYFDHRRPSGTNALQSRFAFVLTFLLLLFLSFLFLSLVILAVTWLITA